MTKGAMITIFFFEKSSLFDVDLFSWTFDVQMPDNMFIILTKAFNDKICSKYLNAYEGLYSTSAGKHICQHVDDRNLKNYT